MVAREIEIYPKRNPIGRGVVPRPVVDRFWEKVSPEPNSGCWLWTAAVNQYGYGVLGIGSQFDGSRRNVLAHRLALRLFKTDPPEHLDVDHLCRVPSCVNPDHLEIVTHRENVMRGKRSDLNPNKRT